MYADAAAPADPAAPPLSASRALDRVDARAADQRELYRHDAARLRQQAAPSPAAPREEDGGGLDWPTARTVRHYLVRLLKVVVESTAYGIGSAIGQMAMYKLHVVVRDAIASRGGQGAATASISPTVAGGPPSTPDRAPASGMPAPSGSGSVAHPGLPAVAAPTARPAAAPVSAASSSASFFMPPAPGPPSAQSVALTALAASAMNSAGFRVFSP